MGSWVEEMNKWLIILTMVIVIVALFLFLNKGIFGGGSFGGAGVVR